MSDNKKGRTSRPLGQPRGLDQIKKGSSAPIKKRLVSGKQDTSARGRRTGAGKRPGKRSRAIAVLFCCGAIAVIGGGAWFLFFQDFGTNPREGNISTSLSGAENAAVSGDRAVVLIFPEWDAMGYIFEERQIPSRNRAGEDLLTIMNALCLGPTISGAVNAIPDGTRALSAFYNAEDHSVVLDFSVELVTQHPGGSIAETATLTSILRTVGENFPDTKGCTILINGAQVETLAGHLNMDEAFDPRRWL